MHSSSTLQTLSALLPIYQFQIAAAVKLSKLLHAYITRKPKLNTIYFGELGENTYNSAICTTFGQPFDTPLTLFDRGLQELGQFLTFTL